MFGRSIVIMTMICLVGCATSTELRTAHFHIKNVDPFSKKRIAREAEEAFADISAYFEIYFQGTIVIERVSALGESHGLAGLADHEGNLIKLQSFSRNNIYHEVAHVLTIYGHVALRRYLFEGAAVYMKDKFAHEGLLERYPGGLHHYVRKRQEELIPLALLDEEPFFAP